MTDPCDNPRYDQKIAYDKKTGTYEISDSYGGSSLNLREVKKLIECVKKTHPELLK